MKNRNKNFWLGILAIMLVFGMTVIACGGDDSGGGDVPPEKKPVAERWHTWTDSSSSAAVTNSVDNNGVCSITVSGTPESVEYIWKANCAYDYTVRKNARYTYVIEAWTLSGDRWINAQFFGGGDANTVGGPPYYGESILLTTTRTRYTFDSVALPKGGVIPFEFQCATQLGTFYVKIVSITENTGGGGGGGQNDPGDLAGTWTGNIGGYNAIITISGSGWIMTASNANFYDSGYFVRNGNTATLYLSSGTNNGTATIINSTTVRVVLNNNTIFPGTYTLTKQR